MTEWLSHEADGDGAAIWGDGSNGLRHPARARCLDSTSHPATMLTVTS
jgi:hypothetical protein